MLSKRSYVFSIARNNARWPQKGLDGNGETKNVEFLHTIVKQIRRPKLWGLLADPTVPTGSLRGHPGDSSGRLKFLGERSE